MLQWLHTLPLHDYDYQRAKANSAGSSASTAEEKSGPETPQSEDASAENTTSEAPSTENKDDCVPEKAAEEDNSGLPEDTVAEDKTEFATPGSNWSKCVLPGM